MWVMSRLAGRATSDSPRRRRPRPGWRSTRGWSSPSPNATSSWLPACSGTPVWRSLGPTLAPPTGTWPPPSRPARWSTCPARSGRPAGRRPAQDGVPGTLGQPSPDTVGLGHRQRVGPARCPDHTAQADGGRGPLALFAVQPALAVRVEEQLWVGVLAGRAVLPPPQLGHWCPVSVLLYHGASYRPDCPAVAARSTDDKDDRRRFPGIQRTAGPSGEGLTSSRTGGRARPGRRRPRAGRAAGRQRRPVTAAQPPAR